MADEEPPHSLVVEPRARLGPLAVRGNPTLAQGLSPHPARGFFVAPMTDDRIIRTLPADLLTPVGAYLLLRAALGAPAFLLESVERGEQVGRYSFLAAGLRTGESLDEA